MRKKLFIKFVAVLICLAFVSIAVPNLNSAEKKVTKVKASLLKERPLRFLLSVFHVNEQSPVYNASRDTGNKPTGDLGTGQPSKGD